MEALTAAQIAEALTALVAHDSDAAKTAKALSEQWEEPITGAELKALRKEHDRQFKRVEAEFNEEKERQIAALARTIAFAASELETALLKKVNGALPQMNGLQAAQAAKAVADVKGKSIDKLMSLTGRDPGEKPLVSDDVMKLIAGGVAKGVFKLSPGIDVLPPGKPSG